MLLNIFYSCHIFYIFKHLKKFFWNVFYIYDSDSCYSTIELITYIVH